MAVTQPLITQVNDRITAAAKAAAQVRQAARDAAQQTTEQAPAPPLPGSSAGTGSAHG